jgi:hypothetical protein
MSKPIYTQEQVDTIESTADRLTTDIQRLEAEKITKRKDAKAKIENLLIGLHNLADEMGVSLL